MQVLVLITLAAPITFLLRSGVDVLSERMAEATDYFLAVSGALLPPRSRARIFREHRRLRKKLSSPPDIVIVLAVHPAVSLWRQSIRNRPGETVSIEFL